MSITLELCCRNNGIRTRKHCQHWWTREIDVIGAIKESPEDWLRSLTSCEFRVVEYLLYLDTQYKLINPSYEGIGKAVGCTGRYVQTIVKKLEQWGVVLTNYRHMTSNLFKISPFFKSIQIRSRLSHFFGFFKSILSLQFLQSKRSYKEYINTKFFEASTERKNEAFSIGEILNMSTVQKPTGFDGISYIVRQQKQLKLTLNGMIRLCAFPDEALYQAFSAYKLTKETTDIYDPYAWIFKVAAQYCHDRDIRIDWERVAMLLKGYDLKGTEPLVEEEQQKITTPVETHIPVLSGFKSIEKKLSPAKPQKEENKSSSVKALFPVWQSKEKELTPEEKLAQMIKEADNWDRLAKENPLILEWTPENPFRKAVKNLSSAPAANLVSSTKG